MNKLLNRPLRAFALYSLIILLISIPVYVMVVDHIWINELDEHNQLALERTKEKLNSHQFDKIDFEKLTIIWEMIQPGMSIVKVDKVRILPDSVYEINRPNSTATDGELDRYRGLRSFLEIDGQVYQMNIETNFEESDETFIAFAIVTLFFFVLLMVGLILLNRKIASNSWKPFYQTLESLKAFDLSKDKTLNFVETDIYEFQELNQSLTKLVERNVAAFNQQKAFTENASHELQTPIAILKSKLDMLLQEKDVTTQIAEMINSIEAPLSRLTRINKNLLLLAKVENQQYNELETIDIKEFVDFSLVLFEDYITDKKLIITNEIEQDMMISANSFLLETLIHNLFSNAIKNTKHGGQVVIKLENRTLSISNSGTEALDSQSLFERFSTTSKNRVSSGLGLAIIKEIANKYHWQVDYHFENGFHTFSITV